MALTDRQRRFAVEYLADGNATAAAVRAGYAERSAKQQGHALLQKPEVAQQIQKLEAGLSDQLGLDSQESLAEILALFRVAKEEQPKVFKGKPVTYVDDDGEVRVVTELRAPGVAARMAELLFRKAGFDVSRHRVEHFEHVVFSLSLDRDLSEEDE